jgi:c-di-GMP-binding flagellar brake protein YcgR
MSTEDRKASRLESAQFISYRLYDSEGRVCEEGMAKTKDISRTGVAVENRTSFEVGAKVELTIALSEELLKTDAIVRNVQKVDDATYQIGLEFIKISEEEIKKLSEEFPSII